MTIHRPMHGPFWLLGAPHPTTKWRSPTSCALEPDVFDAVWAAVEPLVPAPTKTHPLGCNRRRPPDRTCLRTTLIRLVTGCSRVDAEQLVDGEVSDTMLRSRRDEWERAEVFDRPVNEAIVAYDGIMGLDLKDVALGGSQHQAQGRGEGTGKNPADRGNWAGIGRC